MTLKIKTLLVGASVFALAACSDNSSFNSEAGGFIDEGGFGNPTMNNKQAQSGESDFAHQMTMKFGGDVPPTVNFAFNQATLDSEAKSVLDGQAAWMKQFRKRLIRIKRLQSECMPKQNTQLL